MSVDKQSCCQVVHGLGPGLPAEGLNVPKELPVFALAWRVRSQRCSCCDGGTEAYCSAAPTPELGRFGGAAMSVRFAPVATAVYVNPEGPCDWASFSLCDRRICCYGHKSRENSEMIDSTPSPSVCNFRLRSHNHVCQTRRVSKNPHSQMAQ